MDESLTSFESVSLPQETVDELLPEKSKQIYMKVYQTFKEWCLKNNIETSSEEVLFSYFNEHLQGKKIATLWATYSMLKTTIKLKENVDISSYRKLITLLRSKNSTHVPNKSPAFTKADIDQFLEEAPDHYLPLKAILVIGIAGACRIEELNNMLLENIDIRDDIIIIEIPNRKNCFTRKFMITEPLWMEVLKKYFKARKFSDLKRAFIAFRDGKPVRQHIGHNSIGQVPKKVAIFLNLPDINCFTAHSFRKTYAAILAENGDDSFTVRRPKNGKSYAIAEVYIEEEEPVEIIKSSKRQKMELIEEPPGESEETNNSLLDTKNFASSSVNFAPPSPGMESQEQELNLEDYIKEEPTSEPAVFHIENTVVNVPIGSGNFANGSSVPKIQMNCNNCTINYYLKS